jgi:predicted nuclease of restriction endonuclease-like (RecB) superfamily
LGIIEGDDLIGQMELDLKQAFPDMKGFSRRNLIYMRRMYKFFHNDEFVPQAVAQIPWGHIRLILDKMKDTQEAYFYVNKTIENNWSRAVLEHQIDIVRKLNYSLAIKHGRYSRGTPPVICVSGVCEVV